MNSGVDAYYKEIRVYLEGITKQDVADLVDSFKIDSLGDRFESQWYKRNLDQEGFSLSKVDGPLHYSKGEFIVHCVDQTFSLGDGFAAHLRTTRKYTDKELEQHSADGGSRTGRWSLVPLKVISPEYSMPLYREQ